MEKINNLELVTAFRAFGGKIIHVRPTTRYSKPYRGITFAYVRKNNRVVFSTAVQHVNDIFSKKTGTKTAIEHFLAGQCVTIPCRSDNPVKEVFEGLSYYAQL